MGSSMPKIWSDQAVRGSTQILSSPLLTDMCQERLPTDTVGQFLSMITFTNRNRLDELGIDLSIHDQ